MRCWRLERKGTHRLSKGRKWKTRHEMCSRALDARFLKETNNCLHFIKAAHTQKNLKTPNEVKKGADQVLFVKCFVQKPRRSSCFVLVFFYLSKVCVISFFEVICELFFFFLRGVEYWRPKAKSPRCLLMAAESQARAKMSATQSKSTWPPAWAKDSTMLVCLAWGKTSAPLRASLFGRVFFSFLFLFPFHVWIWCFYKVPSSFISHLGFFLPYFL